MHSLAVCGGTLNTFDLPLPIKAPPPAIGHPVQTLLGAMLAGTAALARLALHHRRLGGLLSRETRTETTTTETKRSRRGGLLRYGNSVDCDYWPLGAIIMLFCFCDFLT